MCAQSRRGAPDRERRGWRAPPDGSSGRPTHRLSSARGRRRRLALLVLGGLAAAVLVLCLPALMALGNAWTAQDSARAAIDALRDGDRQAALDEVDDARDDADDMRRATTGLTGAVWSLLPGDDVDRSDVRHLADALDEAASMLEVAASISPGDGDDDHWLTGDDGRLLPGTVKALVDEADTFRQGARSAIGSLRAVEGSSPLLGGVLSSARDAALARVEPIPRTIRLVRPLLPHLPRLLGTGGPQGYLIALLNPAEQRFSGGAALTFVPVFVDGGKVTEGPPLTGGTGKGDFAKVQWERVEHNPFHPDGAELRLSTATFAPSWSVSGEELLRAWAAVRKTEMSGLVVLDVVALRNVLEVLGPVDTQGYGELTADNLVEKLVGSYEEYTSEEAIEERRHSNAALMSAFRSRMASPASLPAKLTSLFRSARERHLAVYHRYPAVQRTLAEMGLDGDLSDTEQDYIGEFNHALSGHKSDYWQSRDVASEVTLRPDGSASVRLTISIFNDAPPPATGVPERYQAYVRRDNDMALAAFLPRGSTVTSTRVDGAIPRPAGGVFEGRPFRRVRLELLPRQHSRVELTYDVPRAAVREGDSLIYRLAVDPPGLVVPQGLHVRVRAPEGMTAADLPRRWSRDGDWVETETDGLRQSRQWEVSFEPSGVVP